MYETLVAAIVPARCPARHGRRLLWRCARARRKGARLAGLQHTDSPEEKTQQRVQDMLCTGRGERQAANEPRRVSLSCSTSCSVENPAMTEQRLCGAEALCLLCR
mmetsp:Transcript_16172/g.51681  ORF Transcript_16172/g.51681 Transcript_16172/m.51681 type:complete len:105 (-) Transcript_16172:2771-3085(-)